MKIKITVGKLELTATLNDSETAKLILKSLPITTKTKLWGEEIYFYVKPKIELEKKYAREIVEVGDIAYWPEGPCMCIFFGPTPNSQDNLIRPASAVNVFGTLDDEPLILKQTKDNDKIKIEKI